MSCVSCTYVFSCCVVRFFFFKQKTAYEMRISDWSSDVCSSDLRPDLLIVARGGGSLEDLMAFNEEAVVRAAAESAIPLISAVGHETDTTLIDFASDRRAPTPTAAAEMAVPVRMELVADVSGLEDRLRRSVLRLAREKRQHLDALGRGLRGPREQLEMARQRFDDLSERLRSGLRVGLKVQRGRLDTQIAKLRPALLRREAADYRRRLDEAGQIGRAHV